MFGIWPSSHLPVLDVAWLGQLNFMPWDARKMKMIKKSMENLGKVRILRLLNLWKEDIVKHTTFLDPHQHIKGNQVVATKMKVYL